VKGKCANHLATEAPLFRVLPSFPRFTLYSAFYPLFRVLPSFPRFTLFSAFYPLFRFRHSGSAIPVPSVRSVPFPRFTPTLTPTQKKISILFQNHYQTIIYIGETGRFLRQGLVSIGVLSLARMLRPKKNMWVSGFFL
jgi:hypothetical protein